MSNLFDVVNYVTIEPDELIVGDRWQWKRTDLGVDYPPASYTLKYECRLEASGSTRITITATNSGSDFVVAVASATTAAYTTGIYHWDAYIVRNSDSERILVRSGIFTVKANLATSVVDQRSHVKKVLDALNAMIEGKASKDQQEYEIQGVRIIRLRPEDIIMWREKYMLWYDQELRAEKIKKGLSSGNKILVRF